MVSAIERSRKRVALAPFAAGESIFLIETYKVFKTL